MERIEKLESQELKDLLIELKEIDTKIVNLIEEKDELEKEKEKNLMLRQKIVDKMKPIVNGEYGLDLDEFEVIASVDLTEEGEISVKIVDELETWKEKRRKSKEVVHAEPEKVEENVAEITE
jgi:hypothetical protein